MCQQLTVPMFLTCWPDSSLGRQPRLFSFLVLHGICIYWQSSRLCWRDKPELKSCCRCLVKNDLLDGRRLAGLLKFYLVKSDAMWILCLALIETIVIISERCHCQLRRSWCSWSRVSNFKVSVQISRGSSNFLSSEPPGNCCIWNSSRWN